MFAIRDTITGEIMESGYTFKEAKEVKAQYDEMHREWNKLTTWEKQTSQTDGSVGPYEIVQR